MKLDLNKIVEILEQCGLDSTQISKVKDTVKTFQLSYSKVYCENCSVVFYEGPGSGILEKSPIIWDFRYLAFRHAWDNPGHNVVVYFPYLNEASYGFHSGIITYSENVDALREKLRLRGSAKLHRSSDENWNPNVDRVLCSTCKKPFNNIRDACYCCYGSKPSLPYQELEK